MVACLVPGQQSRHQSEFPLLGALNWLLVPMALFGAFIGLMSSKKGGLNFCLIVAAFGALRLFLGGGIL